jgi:hypothetical protein
MAPFAVAEVAITIFGRDAHRPAYLEIRVACDGKPPDEDRRDDRDAIALNFVRLTRGADP